MKYCGVFVCIIECICIIYIIHIHKVYHSADRVLSFLLRLSRAKVVSCKDDIGGTFSSITVHMLWFVLLLRLPDAAVCGVDGLGAARPHVLLPLPLLLPLGVTVTWDVRGGVGACLTNGQWVRALLQQMVSIWLGFYRNGKTKFYENKIVVNIVFSVGSPLYLEVYTVLHSEPSPPPSGEGRRIRTRNFTTKRSLIATIIFCKTTRGCSFTKLEKTTPITNCCTGILYNCDKNRGN